MSLQHIDIEGGLRRLADRRIEEAMKEGKFDNLRGMGEPLELEPAPAEENARLMWWALRILKQNDVTPDEVRWRKIVETLKDELSGCTSEPRVRTLCAQINAFVKKLHTLGTNAMDRATPVSGVSLEAELVRIRETR